MATKKRGRKVKARARTRAGKGSPKQPKGARRRTPATKTARSAKPAPAASDLTHEMNLLRAWSPTRYSSRP